MSWQKLGRTKKIRSEQYEECRCSGCGVERFVRCNAAGELRSKRCHRCANNITFTKHGEGVITSRTVEYMTWMRMLDRTRNPNLDRAEHYVGRGIAVCKRWLKYENFLEDMGRRPSPLHSLDRKNNDLGYTPKNCRWATRREQSCNKSTTRWVVLNGQRKSLTEWCEILGISHQTVSNRIYTLKWTAEKALTTPARKYVRARG